MKNRLADFRFFLLAASISAFFPPGAKAQVPRPSPKLSIRYTAGSGKTLPNADSLTLQVRVELPAGWHINSVAPPDSFLVPTRLDAEAKGVQFGKPQFPAPEMVFSQAMGEKLPLYSGIFEVGIPARRLAGPATQALPVTRVTLHYQACNDSMCLPPKDITVEQ